MKNEKPEIFTKPIVELRTKCSCGGTIRVHGHTFSNDEGRVRRYYVDCTGRCGRVSGWNDRITGAMREFEAGGIPPPGEPAAPASV